MFYVVWNITNTLRTTSYIKIVRAISEKVLNNGTFLAPLFQFSNGKNVGKRVEFVLQPIEVLQMLPTKHTHIQT